MRGSFPSGRVLGTGQLAPLNAMGLRNNATAKRGKYVNQAVNQSQHRDKFRTQVVAGLLAEGLRAQLKCQH